MNFLDDLLHLPEVVLQYLLAKMLPRLLQEIILKMLLVKT